MEHTFGASLGHSSISISPRVVFKMTYNSKTESASIYQWNDLSSYSDHMKAVGQSSARQRIGMRIYGCLVIFDTYLSFRRRLQVIDI